MYKLSTRNKGVILITISSIVFSTAGLFTKGISTDSWTIVFWRGIFAVMITVLYVIWKKNLYHEFKLGFNGWIVVAAYISGTPAYIAAFKLTSIANVTLIYAAVPFFAIILAWVSIKERPSRSSILASIFAFIGVGIIVVGSLGKMNLQGDLLALWMTLSMAIMMVIYRRAPNTPVAGPTIVASLFLLPISACFSDPFTAQLEEIPYMAGFGLIFAIASITLASGARYLPASETAILSALEAPLAPILGLIIFSEPPTERTIIGGGIILFVVFLNNFHQNRKVNFVSN